LRRTGVERSTGRPRALAAAPTTSAIQPPVSGSLLSTATPCPRGWGTRPRDSPSTRTAPSWGPTPTGRDSVRSTRLSGTPRARGRDRCSRCPRRASPKTHPELRKTVVAPGKIRTCDTRFRSPTGTRPPSYVLVRQGFSCCYMPVVCGSSRHCGCLGGYLDVAWTASHRYPEVAARPCQPPAE